MALLALPFFSHLKISGIHFAVTEKADSIAGVDSNLDFDPDVGLSPSIYRLVLLGGIVVSEDVVENKNSMVMLGERIVADAGGFQKKKRKKEKKNNRKKKTC